MAKSSLRAAVAHLYAKAKHVILLFDLLMQMNLLLRVVMAGELIILLLQYRQRFRHLLRQQEVATVGQRYRDAFETKLDTAPVSR